MKKRKRLKVFIDTSALIAGIASSTGAAREVLRLAETGILDIFISKQVIIEADRNIESKLPEMLKEYRALMKSLSPVLVDDPLPSDIQKLSGLINMDDAPILAAAIKAEVPYLITWDKRHFINPVVEEIDIIKVVTPGEFLQIVRNFISKIVESKKT